MNIEKKKLWSFLYNKYTIATLCFVVFAVFIDENNYLMTLRLRRAVKELHQEEMALYKDYRNDSIEAQSLKHNREAIERFGRENYYMKRADEDIFIINNHTKRSEK